MKNVDLLPLNTIEMGDVIKLNSGPFVDFVARIEAVDSNKRIWMVLEGARKFNKLKIQKKEQKNFLKI